MAKTKSELFSLIAQNLPDNSNGSITPAMVRDTLTQMADSPVYSVREVELLRASSTVLQAPTALNTPLPVTFGAAQKANTDPVSINAAGLVTFNQAGTYAIRLRLQCGRVALMGQATLLTRILLNGVQTGITSAVRMDSATTITPVEARTTLTVTAGQTLQVQIMRDGSDSAVNAGGLYPVTSAAAAWGVAPSALLVISRLEGS